MKVGGRLVLSREENPVVTVRCAKLGVECIHGELKKADRLRIVAEERGWTLENLIYVGNDVPDIEAMKLVGCSVAVADAYPEVLEIADQVLTRSGGEGAVRELCDQILKQLDG